MMTIGEFAQWSSLTVKALRHYDERGLLVPTEVDPETRYRTYSGGQLRDAVMIKVLRAAGMPIDETRAAISAPDRANDALSAFAARIARERKVQDEALAAAARILVTLNEPAGVAERTAEATSCAAVIQSVPADGDVDESNDRANEAFGALYGELTRIGNPPIGAFWSTILPGREEGRVELMLCWPVEHPVQPDFAVPGLTTRVGSLPSRRELVTSWRWDDPGSEIDDEGPHPALVALLREVDERNLHADLSGLRQIGLMGPDGPVGVEVALPVS